MSGFSHRPTLKQSNKGFKSKHATKSSLKNAAKGRISSSQPTKSNSSSSSKKADKRARLNSQQQKRTLHRQTLTADLKFFSTATTGGGNVPRIISVVPLLDSVHAEDFTRAVIPTLGLEDGEVDGILSSLSSTLITRAPRYKTSLQINHIPALSIYEALSAAQSSDYLVLLLSCMEDVPREGETILRALQGLVGSSVEIICAVIDPLDDSEHKLNPQTRPGVLRSLVSFASYFFPSITKIHVVPRSSDATPTSSSSDANNLARAVCEGIPSTSSSLAPVSDARAWVQAEETDWRFAGSSNVLQAVRWESEGSREDGEEIGTMVVTGTVRGARLSADRLVHVPGWGDFQVSKITAAPPLPAIARSHAKSMAIDAVISGEPLSQPSADADDLTAMNEPDLLANEQTWPTEEDMQGAEEVGSAMEDDDDPTAEMKLSSKAAGKRKVKAGAEGHQASWLIYAEDDDEEDGDDDGDEDDMEEDDDNVGVADGFGGDGGEVDMNEEIDSRLSDGHEDLDDDEEERQLQTYRKLRAMENSENLHFPDEVDTPRHQPAKVRFQRYRGLKSFRTSPWDPYEDLPLDYARIFQFEDYERTRKKVEADGRGEGVQPGSRVEVHISNVPKSLFDSRTGPLVIHGLLQHEHKQSVLHFAVQRNTEFQEPIRAKDPLVLCVGPRRYRIRPIYSQHVRGGGKGANNVHKSDRFLRHGGAVVATTYGPVIFGKQSCILLKETEGDVTELVAMGSFLSADPTRIVAKRIILTGHPFKVHRKTATVRYMFFNRDDINYFAPIELHTKYGRIGHIKEPLGTHGYFKAHFDGPIQQMDTICMSLYKRQYPKHMEPILVTDSERFEEVEADGMDVE